VRVALHPESLVEIGSSRLEAINLSVSSYVFLVARLSKRVDILARSDGVMMLADHPDLSGDRCIDLEVYRAEGAGAIVSHLEVLALVIQVNRITA
jgi:hypothetical protein